MADTDTTATVKVCNKLGLHIRPSRKIAETVAKFDAAVKVRCEDRDAAADSQLDLLMLIAKKGAALEISATGPQAEEAVAAVVSLIEDGFGED